MKSIIFKSEEVRAVLDGRKVQKRIPVKPQPFEPLIDRENGEILLRSKFPKAFNSKCPFGKVGDKLWVKETWNFVTEGNMNKKSNGEYHWDKRHIFYKEREPSWKFKWLSSTNMPRWASRITVKTTDIRVERNEKGEWEWVGEFKEDI